MTTEQQKAFVTAAVTVIIQIAAIFGLTLDEATLSTIIGAVITLVTTAYAIWHNYNFTEAAGEGQKVTDMKKAEANGEIAWEPEELDVDTSAVDEAEDETDSDDLKEED